MKSKFFLSLFVSTINWTALVSLVGLGVFAPSAVSGGASLKEGSFIEAVKEEDIRLLEERIRRRLYGPFADFMKELYFTTRDGRNIFHYLAGVKTEQEKFAVILRDLIRLVYPPPFSETSQFMLAGVVFTPETSPDPDLIFGGDIQEKIKELYKEYTAVYALDYLHRRTETGDLLLMALYKNHLKNLGKDGERRRGFWEIFFNMGNEDTDFQMFHLAKDNNKISPVQLAARNGNKPALNVLNKAYEEPDETAKQLARFGNGALIGAGLGLVGAVSYDFLFSPELYAGNLVLGLGYGMAAGSMSAICWSFFRPIKKSPAGQNIL